MIAKRYRLTEPLVKKVLRQRKAHFSNLFIGNFLAYEGESSRFALILSGKVTRTSVDRNFYRRKFFELARPFTQKQNEEMREGEKIPILDIVFAPKKGTILSRKDPIQVENFEKEAKYLLKKIFRETPKTFQKPLRPLHSMKVR